MAKVGVGTKTIRTSATEITRPAKTVAGSALTQSTSKTSARSGQVLKSVSSAQSEALKRLKDR